MSSIGGLGSGYSGRSDKSLSIPLIETIRLAWADEDLRGRILFVLLMFAVFAFGVHVPVPVPGVSAEKVADSLKNIPGAELLNIFGGGALKRVSVFALGLGPYITSSIIMQVLQTAFPQWKKEMQEGGEYARRQMNKRTRGLTFLLCIVQGSAMLSILRNALPVQTPMMQATVITFWTAGAMFMLWLGEQISEKGIGNGVSLMIFAGIVLSLPSQFGLLFEDAFRGIVPWWSIATVFVIFLAATWFIVKFTIAQRRIPIQHMRRMVGTKQLGGQTSYLPLSVNMVGVIPIIFAASLLGIPSQLSMIFGGNTPGKPLGIFFHNFGDYLNASNIAAFGQPNIMFKGFVGLLAGTALIFFFSYFWTAVQYNVEDISNNLKRSGSFIPGVRPGKQTKDFLDSVISRVTIVGAAFIAVVWMVQYLGPAITGIKSQYIGVMGGTSLLILVSVALETMRQIEANLLMKQYGS
jgi:preprotein translocase subunit SecY